MTNFIVTRKLCGKAYTPCDNLGRSWRTLTRIKSWLCHSSPQTGSPPQPTKYTNKKDMNTPNFISSGSKIVKRLRRRQYDPLIIETTIGLVLGPCTALCRLFLKHCTLTNKAVGTIWRALSKPPQRRQGPDLRPLWLLVGTPSAIRPELAFSRAEHSLPYSDVTIYIFAILYLSYMPYV